jgi:hypothetical protein
LKLSIRNAYKVLYWIFSIFFAQANQNSSLKDQRRKFSILEYGHYFGRLLVSAGEHAVQHRARVLLPDGLAQVRYSSVFIFIFYFKIFFQKI